jgi:2-amino-4-hydroxy-6-hydroxymethyldihydropteridine diphosphokinase
MSACLIGLGSNLGDRRLMLDEAVRRLARHPLVRVAAQSPWRETPPVGGPAGQSAYFNGAILVETSLGPEALLEVLQQVESSLGRRRQDRWGPRTIDLDLLLVDRVVRQTPALELPHPRMTWRRFVLEPAACVAPSMIHPLTGWTVQQHLDHLNSSAYYLAIAGPPGARKSELAERICRGAAVPAAFRRGELTNGRFQAFCAEPAGRARPLALELLFEWSELLSPGWPGWSTAAGAVSDFWFEEALAFARVWLPAQEQEEYQAIWDQARAAVVRPRLVVLLELRAKESLRRIAGLALPEPCRVSRGQIEQFGEELLQLATRPGQGPLLRIRGDDLETALPEMAAAMEAMK